MSRVDRSKSGAAKKAASSNKSMVDKEVVKNTTSEIPLVERIAKRMVEQVSVRHMNPNVCVLTLDRNKGKMGEKVFQGYQTRLISIGELMEIAPNTKLFLGEDGLGTNAALYIEDAEVREYLGFGSYNENGEYQDQVVLTEENILDILNEKSDKIFKEKISSFIGDITKINLIRDMVRRTGFNNAQRVKYIEKVLDIEITF